MKCPICREQAKKVTTDGDGDTLVRCSTDGDFYITPAARRKMEDMPAAARQQALNRAILVARPRMPPTIKKSMVERQIGSRAGKAKISVDY